MLIIPCSILLCVCPVYCIVQNFDWGNFDGFDGSLVNRQIFPRQFFLTRNANIRIFLVITTMSILHYFKRCSKKEVALPELPDPSGSLSKDMPSSSIAAANEAGTSRPP